MPEVCCRGQSAVVAWQEVEMDDASDPVQDDPDEARFAAVHRLYGDAGTRVIRDLAICVVGLGGVGSWAAEALARSGVRRLRLIDPDDVALSNVNRQLHALDGTVGRSKVAVMAERIAAIHPDCVVEALDEPLTPATLERHLGDGLDGVVDAIDVIRFKAALIQFCRRRKIAVITTGGAGRPARSQGTLATAQRVWLDQEPETPLRRRVCLLHRAAALPASRWQRQPP